MGQPLKKVVVRPLIWSVVHSIQDVFTSKNAMVIAEWISKPPSIRLTEILDSRMSRKKRIVRTMANGLKSPEDPDKTILGDSNDPTCTQSP